jgi:SsrA-binding protein
MARFHYEILEDFEAGIILTGKEAKSLRTGKVKLAGGFVSINKNGEAWLKGVDIPEYKYAKGQPHERLRNRKLLLNLKEIERIEKELNEKGATVIPLNLHLAHGKIKVKIALARGKKQWDKRETLKKRDLDREARRSMKL